MCDEVQGQRYKPGLHPYREHRGPARLVTACFVGHVMAASRSEYLRPLSLNVYHLSNAKICFQSFFMLMTVQPFFFASS